MSGIVYTTGTAASQEIKKDSISTKSQRLADMATEVLIVVQQIAGATIRPSADKSASEGAPEPPRPEHTVFALEYAEQKLSAALGLARSIRDAV